MYYTYVMRCEDGSLYTGITTDVQRRFRQHRGEIAGGAKCTKGHRPVAVERVWESQSRSYASKLEYRIKKLTKSDKEILIKDPQKLAEFFGETLDTELYKISED